MSLCDYNILYYLCDLEKMILCSFVNELDSYNFMNAADKGHHAVRTAHVSSGKKYCLVAFDQDANIFIVLPSQAPIIGQKKNDHLVVRCMKSIIASASPNYSTGACLVLHAP